ncbi:MAG TPA: formate dehydrogenase accessory sulfurtransferase FdhD [Polyangia bacterium]|nr:formate dehydrogenase accessory sulfurtransferase FdhD [Polyangia bacterium]
MPKELEISVVRVRGASADPARDWLAVERPLEIRARSGGTVRVISTTMRTPGEDRELAAGFLFAERVITDGRQIRALETVDEDTVVIELSPEADAALETARRPFVTSGACGVCGRTDLKALLAVPGGARSDGAPRIEISTVHALPAALRAAQATFARTGGLHGAGLFTPAGATLAVAEDVGRHNAVDKLMGSFIWRRRLPDPDSVLVVSGRASFELVQKAAVAGIAVMVAVGAPSSLAVEIARGAGMTLLGFVRNGGFNIYCGAERVAMARGPALKATSEGSSDVGYA